jgi:hypothetical protein
MALWTRRDLACETRMTKRLHTFADVQPGRKVHVTMKSLKGAVLLALVLVSALVVVASPAFATPRLTSSTGTAARPDNGAVSPFITPIGDTVRSSINATSPRSDFSALIIGGLATYTITCSSRGTAYVGVTHTQAILTSLVFETCRDSLNGSPRVSTTVSSPDHPWFLHVRAAAGANSWDGTVNIPAGSTASIITRPIGQDCRITVGPQSVRLRDTDRAATRTIEVSDRTVRFSLDAGSTSGCPDPARTATQSGTYTLTPTTPADQLRSTALS